MDKRIKDFNYTCDNDIITIEKEELRKMLILAWQKGWLIHAPVNSLYWELNEHRAGPKWENLPVPSIDI